MRPALAEHGIRVVSVEDLEGEEAEAADRLFYEQVFPGAHASGRRARGGRSPTSPTCRSAWPFGCAIP